MTGRGMDGMSLLAGGMLGTQGVIGAQLGRFQCLGDMQAQGIGFSQADQAAQGASLSGAEV